MFFLRHFDEFMNWLNYLCCWYVGWEHRRWCLLRALTQTGGSVSSGTTSIQVHIDLNEELSLCARGAQDYPKNYYAWTQRLWLLRHLTPLLTPPRSSDDELTDSSDTGIIEERKQVSKKSKVGVVDASTESGGILAVLRGELQFTDNWLRSHTSDHCAISHRHQVYLLLMNSLEPTSSSNGSGLSGGSGADGCVHDSSVVPRILLHMFLSGRRLIDSRPGSESLWCGRRMAVKALLQHILSISVSNPSCGVDSDNMNTKNQLVSVLSESLRINPMSESDRCFEIHFLKLNDLTCISSMALWLDGFLGLEFAYFRQLGATGRNSAAILNAFPILDDNQHQLAEGNTADTIDEPTNGIAWNSEKQLELCKRYLTHLCFQVISFLSSLSNGRDETSLADLLARCQYVFKQLCDEQVTDGLRCEHMKKISDSYNSSAVEI